MESNKKPYDLPADQHWFIDKWQILGYEDAPGFCYGVATEGVLAYLAKNVDQFDHRYALLNEIPAENLKNKIDQARNLLKSWSLFARKKATERLKNAINQPDYQKKLNAEINAIIKELEEKAFANKEKKRLLFNTLLDLDASAQMVNFVQLNKYVNYFVGGENIYILNKIPDAKQLFKYKNSYIYVQDPMSLYQVKDEKLEELKISDPKKFDFIKDVKIDFELPVLMQRNKLSDEMINALAKELTDFHQKRLVFSRDELDYKKKSFIQPKQLEDQGGISQLKSIIGYYDKKELKILFESFQKTLMMHQTFYTEPIGFILSSCIHGISIGYDPVNKTWTFIDANRLPSKIFASVEKLCDEIIAALGSDSIAIRSQIIVAKPNADKMNQVIQHWTSSNEFKKIHDITNVKAQSKDKKGGTLLRWATIMNQKNMMEELIQKGADVNVARNYDNSTPVHFAIDDIDLLSIILKSSKVDLTLVDKDSFTPMLKACAYGRIPVVKKLLALHDSIEPKNPRNLTGFQLAAQRGDIELLQLLKEQKPNMEAACWMDTKDFLKFVDKEEREKFKSFMMKKNKNILPERINDLNAIHLAIIRDRLETLKLLIKWNVNINQTLAGISPVELAMEFKHFEVAKVLIQEHLNKMKADEKSDRFNIKEIIQKSLQDEKTILQTANFFQEFISLELLKEKFTSIPNNTENERQIKSLLEKIQQAYAKFAKSQPTEWLEILNQLKMEIKKIKAEDEKAYKSSHKFFGLFKTSDFSKKVDEILEKESNVLTFK